MANRDYHAPLSTGAKAKRQDRLRQARARREGLPTFKPQQLRLEALLAEGRRLAQEQEHVNRWRLSEEYMRDTGTQQGSLIGLSG